MVVERKLGEFIENCNKNEKLIVVLVLLSHLFLDMFGGYTPILWPLFDKSVYIFTELTTNLNNVSDLNLIFEIRLEKTVFYRVSGVTLLLLIGLVMKNLSIKIHNITNVMRYGIIDVEKRKKD